jgi:hypothetical protein
MSSSTEESAPAESAPAAARPPFSKLAIAALATGVLPLAPVAIGLGIAGLVVTRAGRRRGRGLAIGGLLAATTWIAVGVTLGTVATLPQYSACGKATASSRLTNQWCQLSPAPHRTMLRYSRRSRCPRAPGPARPRWSRRPTMAAALGCPAT